mgnify:CR=1 FL=1
MKNYIKPVIKLAITEANGNVVSCGTTESDMELIQSIVGGANANDTFGLGEDCLIELPLDMYCKFTSAEMGKILVFWS